uniref:Uncharacterized protein n=2 Tax=Plectus sambesii TaxID=2011161 RepID=A0A914XPR6_9BILA
MFKGSRGKALRKEVVKKSRLIEADEPQPVQTATLPPEDALRIKEAIASAKSLREVEQLQQMLQSGHIPGKSAAGNGAAPTGDDEAEMETEH